MVTGLFLFVFCFSFFALGTVEGPGGEPRGDFPCISEAPFARMCHGCFCGRICFWVSWRKRWRRKRGAWRGDGCVDAPVLAEVDRLCGTPEPQRRGRRPPARFPCAGTWRAQPGPASVNGPVSPRPPGAPTSCKAGPVRPPAALAPAPVPLFLQALCAGGFGQEFEVPARVVS